MDGYSIQDALNDDPNSILERSALNRILQSDDPLFPTETMLAQQMLNSRTQNQVQQHSRHGRLAERNRNRIGSPPEDEEEADLARRLRDLNRRLQG